jgi:hypothetical protein
MAVTWNPADKSPLITLSNGDLTATHDATASFNSVRGTLALPGAALVYGEFVVVAGSNNNGVGIANAAASLANYIGFDVNSIAYYGGGNVFLNNAVVASLVTFGTGSRIRWAVNLASAKIWFAKDGGGWNNDVPANQDPAAGLGGISIGALAAGPYFPAWSGNANDASTANFGAAAFAYAVPSGFSTLEAAASLTTALGPVTATAAGEGAEHAAAATLGPMLLDAEGYVGAMTVDLSLSAILDPISLVTDTGGPQVTVGLGALTLNSFLFKWDAAPASTETWTRLSP